MKAIFIGFVVLIGTFLAFMMSLRNGSLLRYLDAHPHPELVPKIEYAIGHGFSLVGEFVSASTYYIRIPERYPKSPLADSAYYNYLSSMDDTETIGKEGLIAMYETYLAKYPKGAHTEIVQQKIINIRNR